MKGRKVEPIHQAKQRGEDRARKRDRPDISVIAFEILPPPPYWLDSELGIAEYNRLGKLLTTAKMLNDFNINVFGVFCQLFGIVVGDMAEGKLPNASVLGQFRGITAEFGLTPSAMSKFPGMLDSNNTPQGNAFSSNGKKFA